VTTVADSMAFVRENSAGANMSRIGTIATVATALAIAVAATVGSIDFGARLVSLRGTDGRTATIYAAPDVRNLDQVRSATRLT
jgi:hypothetical protein